MLDAAEQRRWFAEEVQPHESELRGYLRRQFPSVEVDDVVQESYIKLLQIHAAGKISFAKAYVFSIARNTARRLFRRRQFYSDIPVNDLPDSSLLDEGNDAAEFANARQQLELAIAAVDELPARCREIVALAALQGLTNAEIARKLRLSENTVRVQMGRGIRKCVEYLAKRGERP